MKVSKVRQSNAKNILARIKAGKTVSSKDRIEAEEVLALLEEPDAPSSANTDVLIVNVNVMMKLFGINTRKTIGDWVNMGMPKFGHNKYNLYDVFDWKRDRDETGAEIAKASKERYWKAKADNEEIKRDISKEDLIPRSDILPEWCARVGELTQSLEGIAIKLPPLLEGKNQKQMHKILYDEVGLMRDSYARIGKYTPICPTASKPNKVVKRRAATKKKPIAKKKAVK